MQGRKVLSPMGIEHSQIVLCRSAACPLGAALAAAEQGVNAPFVHYEPYWVEGLPCTAAGLSAAIAAGIPIRAVIWLQPSADLVDSAAFVSVRPASASSRLATAGQPTLQTSLPSELQQLQVAVSQSAWDEELSSLLVLRLPVEDASSPFTKVPLSSSIADPPWAAAAAAVKTGAVAAAGAAGAAVAGAAPDVKPAAGSGGKPVSAASGTKTPGSTPGARPGSSVAGGNTAAAAAEDVLGCKELARAVLTIRNHAKYFDQWRERDVRVYRMPLSSAIQECLQTPGASQGSDSLRLVYYNHLLDSVPPERQSVPVVLHAMLEQASDTIGNFLFDRLTAAVSGSAVMASCAQNNHW